MLDIDNKMGKVYGYDDIYLGIQNLKMRMV